MKKTTNTNSVWEQSKPTIEFVAKHPAQDVDEWRKLTSRMVDAATEFGWSKAEVSRRTDVPDGTLSPWFSGKYLGVLSNINQKVANWLDALDASQNMAATMPVSPPFQRTAVGQDVYNALLFAQVTSGFVRIVLPAGSGKTTAAKHFLNTRPHVFMATLSPSTKTVHGMRCSGSARAQSRAVRPLDRREAQTRRRRVAPDHRRGAERCTGSDQPAAPLR